MKTQKSTILVKSVKHFSLPHPLNSYSADLVPLYGPSPFPNLVNVVKAGSEMIQPDFNIVFLGGGGVVAKWYQEL